MVPENVDSVLFTSDCDDLIAQSFLFQVARHFCSNGLRVVYIAPDPISALPPCVNDNDVLTDPEIMRLLSFTYLESKADLIKYLAGVLFAHKPPIAIVIQQMERYCTEEESPLIAGMLFNAASSSGHRLRTQATLVASYKIPLPTILARNFFHNIWCIHSNKDNLVVLKNLGPMPSSHPAVFQFSLKDNSARLIMEKLFISSATNADIASSRKPT